MKTKPDYYKSGKMDVIDFCRHHELGFCEGNVIKYITRAGKKESRLDDLLKAREYVDRLIEGEQNWVGGGTVSGEYKSHCCGEYVMPEIKTVGELFAENIAKLHKCGQ